MKKDSILLFTVCISCLLFANVDATESVDAYFLKYLDIEKSNGFYMQRPLRAKEPIIEKIQERNLAIDLGIPDERVLNLYYEDLENTNIFNVMQKEWGKFESRAAEQKAEYSNWSGIGNNSSIMPEYPDEVEKAISQNEAIEIAERTLLESFEISESDLESRFIETSLLKTTIYGNFGDNPLWIIRFRDRQGSGLMYEVVLDMKGKVLVIQAPQIQPILLSDCYITDVVYVTPKEYDIDKNSAINNAIQELSRQYNVTSQKLRKHNINAQYIVHERFCLGCEPVWLIEFKNGQEKTEYRALVGYDGEVIDVVSGKKEFVKTQRSTIIIDDMVYPNGIVNEKGTRFDEWSLEDKANFSKEWIPYIENYVKSNPYYPNYNRALYLATRHVYGIPDSHSISQEKALRIARKAITEVGADEKTIHERCANYYYDITDEEKPLWKIDFGISKTQVGANWLHSFRAIIDAKTGDILDAYDADGKTFPLY